MKSSGIRAAAVALLLLTASCVQGDFVEPAQASTTMRSLTESPTRLPCHYRPAEGQNVVQVSWDKVLPDGTKEQITTAHFQAGFTGFGRYSGRVKFESNTPTENSALLITVTEDLDEGIYLCRITTFPSGNFERHITLKVWTLPISSLDPVTLVEGQPYGVVASCRAVGRPAPLLSWDTELPGKSQNHTSESGAVSAQFYLHPLRHMNGQRLDCLVSHPGLEKPRRISNRLVVQYPPDATISTSPNHWHVGLKKAELVCTGGGYPKPNNITWIRKGSLLPDGVSVIGGKLTFSRALRTNDSGVYECIVQNTVGTGRTEYILAIAEKSEWKLDAGGDNMLLIIVLAAAAAVVLILVVVVLLVNRHHRNRNKKLKNELNEKREEVDNLSRQASMRGLNSVSYDPRAQNEDYAMLKVDSRIKNSQMSLERTMYRGSQSTLGGRMGHPILYDKLGRPVVWDNSSRDDLCAVDMAAEKEHRRRLESLVKSSNMSLDSGLPSSLVPLKPQQDDCVQQRELDPGHAPERDSPLEDDWAPSQSPDEDDQSSAHRISAALANHFYKRDGVLRPRPQSNAILLEPNGYMI